MAVRVMRADRQCNAMSRRTGERCRDWAVQGARVCWHHGGAAPQVRNAGARRQAVAEAVAMLDELPTVEPAVALERALAVLHRLLGTNLDKPDAADLAERVARVAKTAADVGVAERRVQLAEAQAVLVAEVIGRILTALGVDTRARRVVEVVGRELRALEVGP